MSDTYIIEVEASEGNFFKEITDWTVKRIMKLDDGEKAYELIINGTDACISNMQQVDMYFGYPEQWKDVVKNEWKEHLR